MVTRGRQAWVAAGIALATLGSGGADAAGGGGQDASPEPVPTGEQLAERCREYRQDLEFTRAQLRERNFLARLDLLRTAHRKRERFVDAHCEGIERRES